MAVACCCFIFLVFLGGVVVSQCLHYSSHNKLFAMDAVSLQWWTNWALWQYIPCLLFMGHVFGVVHCKFRGGTVHRVILLPTYHSHHNPFCLFVFFLNTLLLQIPMQWQYLYYLTSFFQLTFRWALAHLSLDGAQRNTITTPDFLDMVPWYSGYKD